MFGRSLNSQPVNPKRVCFGSRINPASFISEKTSKVFFGRQTLKIQKHLVIAENVSDYVVEKHF